MFLFINVLLWFIKFVINQRITYGPWSECSNEQLNTPFKYMMSSIKNRSIHNSDGTFLNTQYSSCDNINSMRLFLKETTNYCGKKNSDPINELKNCQIKSNDNINIEFYSNSYVSSIKFTSDSIISIQHFNFYIKSTENEQWLKLNNSEFWLDFKNNSIHINQIEVKNMKIQLNLQKISDISLIFYGYPYNCGDQNNVGLNNGMIVHAISTIPQLLPQNCLWKMKSTNSKQLKLKLIQYNCDILSKLNIQFIESNNIGLMKSTNICKFEEYTNELPIHESKNHQFISNNNFVYLKMHVNDNINDMMENIGLNILYDETYDRITIIDDYTDNLIYRQSKIKEMIFRWELKAETDENSYFKPFYVQIVNFEYNIVDQETIVDIDKMEQSLHVSLFILNKDSNSFYNLMNFSMKNKPNPTELITVSDGILVFSFINKKPHVYDVNINLKIIKPNHTMMDTRLIRKNLSDINGTTELDHSTNLTSCIVLGVFVSVVILLLTIVLISNSIDRLIISIIYKRKYASINKNDYLSLNTDELL